MTRLAGKHVIVTGAGSGIGDAIARRFVHEGASVLAVDLAVADEPAAESGTLTYVRADVTKTADIERVVAMALDQWGSIEALCNCAGVSMPPTPLAEIEEAVFDRIMDVNARGVFLAMKHTIPAMLAGGGGAIVNIASIGSFVAQPGISAYYGSKGACLMLTRAAAMDYASQGIRINAICPGLIETPLIATLPPETIEARRLAYPVGRLGQPEEIAAMAVLLASDECTFATGAAFVVDGGFTAR